MDDAEARAKFQELLGVEIVDMRIAVSRKGGAKLMIEADGIELQIVLDLNKYNILVEVGQIGSNLSTLLVAALGAYGIVNDEAHDIIEKIAVDQIKLIDAEREFIETLSQAETIDDLFGGDKGADG